MISPLSNEKGKAIDWWFIYKLPMDVGPNKDSTGFEFLYCDSSSEKGLELAEVSLDHDKSALALTLNQIFEDKKDIGYVLWNDEIPPTKENEKPKNLLSKGHSKGILAFSKEANKGFYLLHSTPRFPAIDTIELPDNEKRFGQVYLCISLEDYSEVDKLADILRLQNEVQVYASKIPGILEDEAVYKLAKKEKITVPSEPSFLKIKTKKGNEFTHIAKNKQWSEPTKESKIGKDFWKDLVGPYLKCNLNVETWRRGLVFGDIDSDGKDDTMDDVDIDLSKIGLKGYKWAYSKDHSKWGISTGNVKDLIIISDLNRQTSQCKRGGGGLAFSHAPLWNSLNAIEITEKNLEKDPHRDKS